LNLRNIITGSDPEDEKLSASLGIDPYRRWYCFGKRSPGILISRLRHKYYPVHRTRLAWQRLVRGHDDAMLWNLNYTLAKLTVDGVRALRKWKHGYPAEFCDPEESGGFEGAIGGGWEAWDDVLRRIEEGFQAWIDEDGHFFETPEQEKKFKDAMELYAKWFGALWD